MAKKKTLDPVHGAVGQELTDEDIDGLETDVVTEGFEPEPLPEEVEQEDLPEGITEPEEDEPPEPAVDPEVERLKKLGLYRPGLVESFDDLGKSYKHLENEFQRRPVIEKPVEPQVDPQKMMNELYEEYNTDPIMATVKIVNAMSQGTSKQLSDMAEQLFYSNHSDASDFKDDIETVRREFPNLGIQAAYDMARGRNIEKVQARVIKQEQGRAAERQLALREKPGGIRTTPTSHEEGLKRAMAGKSGTDAVDAMVKYLERAGMGAKD